MREVIVGEHAGFCFGAARAVETLEKSLKENVPIYTYGPILNNTKLVEDYERMGAKVVESVDELFDLPKGKVIIRAHGVPRAVFEKISASGHEIFDATCPFVKRIQRIAEKQSAEGDRIVVIGNPKHPEVEGIVGWSHNGATVIENREDVEQFVSQKDERICIVSQTTFNLNKFQELVELFAKKGYTVNVINTICDATQVRQSEAYELSKQAEVMIVIGDTHSSNSKKLYEICKANCDNTFFVQDVKDIEGKLPTTSGLTGITAGASTPKYIIEEVQNYVRNDF